jgi:hypothetical protein
MLIEELDVAIVDALGNLLADLVRASALNHVQSRPAVLRLCAGRSANEECVFQLALEAILLDVICQSCGDFSTQRKSFELATASTVQLEQLDSI